MPLPVEIGNPAERELAEALAWYCEQSPRAAARLLIEFEHALFQIGARPELGTPYVAGTRHVALRRFPYLVVYEVLPDFIRVVAFSHGSRRRGYWAHRLRP